MPKRERTAGCEVCAWTGEREVDCSCVGQPPQYDCKRCGNCGVVVVPCDECSEEDES